jgi:hypothetical protein
MKKLLSIKDSGRFWKVFDEERRKRRSKLRKLSFAKKVAIVERMKASGLLKERRQLKTSRYVKEEKRPVT